MAHVGYPTSWAPRIIIQGVLSTLSCRAPGFQAAGRDVHRVDGRHFGTRISHPNQMFLVVKSGSAMTSVRAIHYPYL